MMKQNEKTLYLECYSGISGDMSVAALLDLGADKQTLLNGLSSLNVHGFQIKIGRCIKSGIDACDFDVILEQTEHASYHTHHTDTSPIHPIKKHQHSDCDISEPIHKSFSHTPHRNLFEIETIIESSTITSHAKELAKKIFHIIAKAEAKAHALSIEKVHFHEVGALDSIADIVGTAICLDNLNITNVIISELYEGSGHIECQHGTLPIPVPAVCNIISSHKIPIKIIPISGELVTPTGAAIVAAIRTQDKLPECYTIDKIGLGAGKRNYSGVSGILRAMLITPTV